MAGLEQLTTRERQCLVGVAQHRQSKEIARDLGISSKTVDKHIETACKKLGDVTPVSHPAITRVLW
ncbi:LuxR C-terminal-related transcriptional regulator [Brevundimonas staleyi]|uniref:LuxR C-terminal-related transcriptional regulator n=1 Tax=Brevundimonas staleyi TaxID=74326 RepID=A0ABW0FX02_9CAUL